MHAVSIFRGHVSTACTSVSGTLSDADPEIERATFEIKYK
jgi:hypothetical protein